MQTAMLDSDRFGWSRFDWDDYNVKDKEYGERLITTAIEGNFTDLQAILNEGSGYYHFPDNNEKLIKLQEVKPALFFFLMNTRSNFYQYDSLF